MLRANEIDAHKADENAEALTQRDRLVIDQQTDREQHAGQRDVCDQRTDTDLPACAVETDISELQSHNGYAENPSRPVCFAQLTGKSARTGQIKHDDGQHCAHTVGAPVPMTAEVQEILQWLHSNGKGQADHSAIAQYYEHLTGIKLGRDL